MTKHPIEPVFNEYSRILILGSFPSVKSREEMFFYGHPRNRFWKVLAAVLEAEEPKTVEEKKQMLLKHNIALWDVIASCEISGSSDSSIKNVMPNDVGRILKYAPIEKIFINGRTAEKYYRKHLQPVLNRKGICLPSTSPANASWPLDRLTEEWKRIRFENM
ncbi:MAG: DNA-deoxyinosine glycosylase [Oscillospiraceae bacterium]|nr:DNA-deoxyinosine glycosylase [Oscillospiraceae bacterium]